MTERTPMLFTYEERQALAVLRKSMRTKPQVAAALIEGMSRETAVSVLQQAQTELADLLKVTQALSAAAQTLIDLEKKP